MLLPSDSLSLEPAPAPMSIVTASSCPSRTANASGVRPPERGAGEPIDAETSTIGRPLVGLGVPGIAVLDAVIAALGTFDAGSAKAFPIPPRRGAGVLVRPFK